MKRENREGKEDRKKPVYSQSDLLDFYKNYGSKKQKKDAVEEKRSSKILISSTGSIVEVASFDSVMVEEQSVTAGSTGDDLSGEKPQSYAEILSELQIAHQDLLEARQQFKEAKARVSFLEEELVALGKDLMEEEEDEFEDLKMLRSHQIPERSENSNQSSLGSVKFLEKDQEFFEQYSSGYTKK